MTAFKLEVEPASRYVIIELSGLASVDSLPQIGKALLSEPDWRPEFDIIVVIGAESELGTATLPMLQTVQARMREWNATNRTGAQPRTALVCPDDIKRVIPELWSAMNARDWPIDIGVFKTLQLARDWLAHPSDQAEAPPPAG